MADDVSCRLTTRPMFDADPPALRIVQIAWDSGFRGSGLQVGDLVVAIDGVPLDRPADAQALARATQSALGTYGEPAVWAKAGRGEGAPVTLTVRRRNVPGTGWSDLAVTGTLQPQRAWRSEQNQPLMGPGGPPQNYEYDGFSSSWSNWHEQEVLVEFVKVLDDPFFALAQTTRYLLQQHLARRPRIELLVSKYPGPFATAMRDDFERVLARLQGEPVAMGPGAMDFRQREAQQIEEARQAAVAAWQAAQVAASADTVPAFPAVDPSRQSTAAVVGKTVVLGPLRNQDWISDSGRTWFVAGDEGRGFYFLDAEGPEAEAMLRALQRYRRLVAPDVASSFEFLARVLDAPRLGVVNGRAHFGLQVQLRAALVGGAMFVDLANAGSGPAPFAGEAAFAQPQAAMPADDASPADVLRAFVAAVKDGDLALWKRLFSNWRIEYLADRRPLLYPQPVQVSESRFEDARRLILGKVCDARPIWTGDARVVIPKGDYPGAMCLEEIDVQLQHVGLFDGEYRPFSDVTVTDFWKLQRVNGGPWRIADSYVL